MASFRLLCSVILLLLTSSNSSSSNDEGNDSYNCVTPKKECGNCIALPECDSLSKILTETPSNPKSIRYLQKSTCGFSDDKVPLVCCPIPFSSNSKKSDICSDILPTSDTSNTADTTITTTPAAITTTIETTTPTTNTSTTTTTAPTTQSSTTTPTTTSTTESSTITSTTTESSTTTPTTTEVTTTTPTTTTTESTTTIPPTTESSTTVPTTTTPTPTTTTDYTPSSITTEKQSTDTLFNSSLITTEKPPEHLGGSNNQTESLSQSLAEKIISHPNLHLLPNSSECGISAVVDKIVGGQDAGLGRYPWMVLLGFSDDLGRIQYACGGTLISSRYVLTAAHCVAKLPAGFKITTVRVGDYDQSTDPDCFNGVCAPKVQNIDIEQVIHHEDYDKTNHKENDIAVLRLKAAAELSEFVRPVCLSHGEAIKKPKKISFVVSGFGRVTFDSPANAKILQEVTVPLVPTQICNNFYESKEQVGHIDDSRFCAGGQNGKGERISLTSGDFSQTGLLTPEITHYFPAIFGIKLFALKYVTEYYLCLPYEGNKRRNSYIGPLMTAVIMAKTYSQRFFQYGIVSIGPSHCGVAAQPALYTRVQHYMLWILDHIQP